jgi:hypothetical protein
MQPLKIFKGFAWKTSKTEKEDTQKLKFYSSHCFKLQNQISQLNI